VSIATWFKGCRTAQLRPTIDVFGYLIPSIATARIPAGLSTHHAEDATCLRPASIQNPSWRVSRSAAAPQSGVFRHGSRL
jgi:hypothetical protein